jgi:hypothetical protein
LAISPGPGDKMAGRGGGCFMAAKHISRIL